MWGQPTATKRRRSRRIQETILNPTPLLTLTKEGVLDRTVVQPADRANVGDIISYTLLAQNAGTVTLTGVTITDAKLPSLSCTPVQPATLAVGEAMTCTGIFTLTQAAIDAGTVLNTGTAHSDQTPPTQAHKELPLNPGPALALDKSVDKTVVAPGTQVIYTFLVTNTGNVVAG